MTTNIKIQSKKVLQTLLFVAFALSLLFLLLVLTVTDYTAASQNGFLALFNVNAEVSIPTWYSQTLLFIVAICFCWLALMSNTDKKYWAGLGVIFLYISVDEGAAIHELATQPMRELLGITSGPLYYAWIVAFGLIGTMLILLYSRFILRLPTRTKYLVIAAGITMVLGGIGFEMIGASIAAAHGETGIHYAFAVAAEELLEMTGAILFTYALLDYLKHSKQKSTTVFL